MLGDVVRNDSAALEKSCLECERIANESSSSFLSISNPSERRGMASKHSMHIAGGQTILLTEIGCLISQSSPLSK